MKNFEKSNNDRQEIIKQQVSKEIKDLYPVFSEIDKMPEGCAVIGGAARSLAFHMVNKNIEGAIPIRDVDLAFFEGEISQSEADVFAEFFSPDDYAHNHGAQEIVSVEEYMDSRDFTMNQVIYKDGELIMSRAAIRDIYKGVINPCEDRAGYWDEENNNISTRLALKAILQKTVLSDYIEDVKINDRVYNDRFYIDEYESYNGFQLALAIQKAFDYGDNTPQRFIEEVVQSDIFENSLDFLCDEKGEIRDLYSIMTDLNESVLNFPFDFRNAAGEFYMQETDDKAFAEKMNKYEFFEEYLDKNDNYRYK